MTIAPNTPTTYIHIMMVSVTTATNNELDAVAQLYKQVGYGGGVSPNDVTLIARSTQGLIGAVRLCQEDKYIVLRGMHIHPDFQRQGVGQILLTQCVPYLNQGQSYCLPYTHLTQFYGQIGFKVAERQSLPLRLAERLDGYIASGQLVLAMERAPALSMRRSTRPFLSDK